MISLFLKTPLKSILLILNFLFSIDVRIVSGDNNKQFGFKLSDDELYGQLYINKIKEKSTVEKTFNKTTYDKLKGSFITHIDGNPVFSTKDAKKK